VVISSEHLESLPQMKTAKEYVYDALRLLIVRGALEPGTALPLGDVASDLQVSTMPVRSALALLEAEGLVRQLPRRGGAIVAPVDLEDFEEIQAIRFGIESFAAQLGAQRIDEPGLDEMRLLRARIRNLAGESDPDALLAEIFAFHNVCYRAARRPRLLRLIEDHQRRAERYLRIALQETNPGFDAHVQVQDRFLATCESHDGPAAAAAVRDALTWTFERLRPVMESRDAAGSERV
jgi:DNA-binding GntR family transcriptional regulator